MTVFLLDVNVLVALFDPAHVHHDAAHDWFGSTGKKAWATCPITENGLVRILSHPSYPTVTATPAEVIERLRTFCKSSGHAFWSDAISLTDVRVFRTDRIGGAKTITDAYLLGLAVHHGGRLATFDRGIPAGSVLTSGHALEVIGAA